MKDKKIVGVVVTGLLVAGISFWGGMTYAGNNLKKANENRQGVFNQNGGMKGQGARVGNGGVVSGEVLSVDSTSMTVKLRDGGSKIVLLSPASKVEKTVDGVAADVTVGKSVMVTGTTNPDGSVTASSVQLRPSFPVMPVKTN